jgi:3-methyladenine DNA glycosylase AlkD
MIKNSKNLIYQMIKQKRQDKAEHLSYFFKTGKGQYGEGDLFLGIDVPDTRKMVKDYVHLDLKEISKILSNKYHEIRLVGLLILVNKYQKANKKEQKEIFDFYLKNYKNINNWDLVDLSAYHIVGDYLLDKDKKILEKLAKSKNLWQKRIAIISTFAFIQKGQGEWTFRIVKILMQDPNDLIHKACGWMLREVGKKISDKELKKFLDEWGTKMPRTMLRYAIEKFEEKERIYYLNKK